LISNIYVCSFFSVSHFLFIKYVQGLTHKYFIRDCSISYLSFLNQFYQQFSSSFFVSTYSTCCNTFAKRILSKKLPVKCCWNWPLCYLYLMPKKLWSVKVLVGLNFLVSNMHYLRILFSEIQVHQNPEEYFSLSVKWYLINNYFKKCHESFKNIYQWIFHFKQK